MDRPLDNPDCTPDLSGELDRVGVLHLAEEHLDAARFASLLGQLVAQPRSFPEGATSRRHLGPGIWVETESAEKDVAPVGEATSCIEWPAKVLLGCVTAPDGGGESILTDRHAVFADLPTDVVREFIERDWRLVRTFRPGQGPSWQETFAVDTMDALHQYCRTHDIDVQWLDKQTVRTRQIRRAVARHPRTGALLWFNDIARWHRDIPDDIEPHEEQGIDDAPGAGFYGDGTPVPAEVIATIRDAYARHSQTYRWQPGRLLLIDNMRIAHGRRPYVGQRTVLTGSGEAISRWATSTLDALDLPP